MKPIVTGLLTGVFLFCMLSSDVLPLPYDPNLPSRTIYENSGTTSSGDDSHWGDPNEAPYPGGGDNWSECILGRFLSFHPGLSIFWHSIKANSVKPKTYTELRNEEPNRYRIISTSGETAPR